MSTADLDALAESARNRGLKLVRSRVRTPGKGDFGKVGLTDLAGKPVFGMDGKAVTATPNEAEAYLRTLGASDWTGSLGLSEMPKKRGSKAARARVPEPEPEPEPELDPEPEVRDAVPDDAASLVPLMKLLGHEVAEAGVRKRIAMLTKAGEAPLVATIGTEIAGLCGLHRMVTVHRDAPVGRVTILVVAEASRARGIGRLMVERAETVLRAAGCELLEITSNDRLTQAHAFYRHIGYERTGMRFAKPL